MSYLNTENYYQIAEDALIPQRIFLNHVDQYHGRHIGEYITDQLMGALKEAREGVGDEGLEEEPTEAVPKSAGLSGNKYEIIGTKRNKLAGESENVKMVLTETDADFFIKELLKCGFIVYDISHDPLEIPKALAVLSAITSEIDKIKDIGPKTFQKYDRQFVFILISNVLTWAKSKPPDPEDPEVAFNEADYRRRKAHPNCPEQIACEREVILKGRKYKEKLKTYVVCCGITYGFDEEDMLFYFKMAWNNAEFLPLFQPGNNIIPFLHVQDLARVLHALMELQPKKPQYILAVEQTACKQKQFVKALSKVMGRGKLKEVVKEEAFLYNNMTQSLYDRYTLNLNMEPSFIVDELGVEFRSDLNLAENMSKIVTEFRNWRNLEPKRLLLHGPPASGKTKLAKRLAEKYGLHYISVKTMIEETTQELRSMIDYELAKKKQKEDLLKAKADAGADEEDEEAGGEEAEEEDENVVIEQLMEKLRDIETTLESSDHGKLPDDYVIRLLKSLLSSNVCLNQGYVLDGYPKTMVQVKELFGLAAEGAGEGVDEGEDEDAGPKVNIMPTNVISLDGDDEFLYDRIMNIPEKEVQGTHYTEEHMLRRMMEFRANNTEDNTILNFFDENEIHPVIFNVMEDFTLDMDVIFEKLTVDLGLPIGFELTDEEADEWLRCQDEAQKLERERMRLEKIMLEEQALEEYQVKMEEKIHLLEELQMEEEKILAVKCEPLRGYLMKYVFPTLTEGLLEVARVKPKDPVDYLAEYLFKVNPEGKMFDPAYTRQGELIEQVVQGR